MASDQRLAFTDDPHRIQGNGVKSKERGSSSKQKVQQESRGQTASNRRLMGQKQAGKQERKCWHGLDMRLRKSHESLRTPESSCECGNPA